MGEVESAFLMLEAEHAGLLDGVLSQQYALWTGAGISLGRAPGLKGLITKVICFLGDRADAADPSCPYRRAAEEILALTPLGTGVSSLDPSRDPDALDAAAADLVEKYPDVLNVRVGSEPEDFLLWNVVDVPQTYGPAAANADIEHVCLAFLISEGVVTSIFSGNWDCNIEDGLARICRDHKAVLNVAVTADQLRRPPTPCRLHKFHGCARLAETDLEQRKMLVARRPQLRRWSKVDEWDAMRKQITAITSTQRTLMLGFSAGDDNILGQLSSSFAVDAWKWDERPVPMVFAERSLSLGQRELMQSTYGDLPRPELDDSEARARFPMYARPLLAALLVQVLLARLLEVLPHVPGSALSDAGYEEMSDDLREACLAICRSADTDLKGFLQLVVSTLTFATAAYFGSIHEVERTGGEWAADVAYVPVHSSAPAFAPEVSGAAELACAVAMLTSRHCGFDITFDAAKSSTLRVDSGSHITRVFLVRDDTAELALRRAVDSGVIDQPDVLLIHGRRVQPRPRRSSRGLFGRTGTPGPRVVSVAALLGSETSPDQLIAQFKSRAVL